MTTNHINVENNHIADMKNNHINMKNDHVKSVKQNENSKEREAHSLR